MAAFAAQLGLLTLLLADLAAVFSPLSALGDRAGTGGVRAFLGGGHFSPPVALGGDFTHHREARLSIERLGIAPDLGTHVDLIPLT
jgi:hypothetical protein